jgi:hypothetical protein
MMLNLKTRSIFVWNAQNVDLITRMGVYLLTET